MNLKRISSPLGPLTLGESDGALVCVTFGTMPEAGEDSGPNPILTQAEHELEEYFAGRRTAFSVPMNPAGTPFQRKVWAALCQIPYGETISYGELARRIGSPKAARAVGMANHRNSIPILIPCHRVIGANGALVGYSDGLEIKSFLLNLERHESTAFHQ